MDLIDVANLPIELKEIVEEYRKGSHWQHMNFEVQSINKGFVSLKLTNREEFNNIKGTIHGGIIAALLDTTMGMTARTMLKGSPVTIQLNIQYVKPVINETIFSKSKMINISRQVCFLEGQIFDGADNLIAFATGSFKVS